MGHAQIDHIQSGQNAHVPLVADAHDHLIAILDSRLLQRLLLEISHHVGVLRIAAHPPDLLLILIQHQNFLSGFRQGAGQGAAKPSHPDNSVGRGVLLSLFSKHNKYLPL